MCGELNPGLQAPAPSAVGTLQETVKWAPKSKEDGWRSGRCPGLRGQGKILGYRETRDPSQNAHSCMGFG